MDRMAADWLELQADVEALAKLNKPGVFRDGFLLAVLMVLASGYAFGVFVGWLTWAYPGL